MKKSRIAISFFLCCLMYSLFAIDLNGLKDVYNDTTISEKSKLSSCIISPVSGTWANYQSLVLKVPEDYIALYSFTGEDPLSFGFAYDEAVLIEKEGAVDLRIVFVSSNGETYEFRRNYEVAIDSKQEFSPNEKDFLSQNKALIILDEKNTIDIPKAFSYSLRDGETPYALGRNLFLGENDLERYVPLLVEADSKLYRWMLYLDRVAEKNPFSNEEKNLTKTIEVSNPSFQIAFQKNGFSALELKPNLKISVLEGEYFSKTLFIDLYQDSEYKASIAQEVLINKKIPQKPRFISSAKDFYSRDKISLRLEKEMKGEAYFYYLFDEPEILHFDKNSSSYQYEEKIPPLIEEVKKGTKTKEFKLDLETDTEAVLYRIYAIKEDSDGNLSDIASYVCIIDAHNYFIDSERNIDSLLVNGSPEFPFSNLHQALDYLKDKKQVNLHILSNDKIEKPLKIIYNRNFIGYDTRILECNLDARIDIENAQCTFSNIVFLMNESEKAKQSSFQKEFFRLQKSKVLFDNSDFNISHFGKFNFLTAINSRVDFFHSSFVSHALEEASFLFLIDSEINILSSNISILAPRGLIFSSINGNVHAYESLFRGSGNAFKFADLINTEFFFVSNEFYTSSNELYTSKKKIASTLDLPKDLFFIDFKSKQIELFDNTLYYDLGNK